MVQYVMAQLYVMAQYVMVRDERDTRSHDSVDKFMLLKFEACYV